MKNLGYLFAAYSVVWLALFGYICLLYNQQCKLQQELEALSSKLKLKRD